MSGQSVLHNPAALKRIIRKDSRLEVAKLPDLSPRTLDYHRVDLVRKSGLKNTTELVNYVVPTVFSPSAKSSVPDLSCGLRPSGKRPYPSIL